MASPQSDPRPGDGPPPVAGARDPVPVAGARDPVPVAGARGPLPESGARHQKHPHSGHGAGLALLAVLVQTVGTTIAATGQPAKLDLLGYALLAISGMALGGRHRSPVTTMAMVAAATVTYHVLDYPNGPTYVALIIAVLSAMKAGHHGLAWATSAISFATWVFLTGTTLHQALPLAAWGIGLGVLAEAVIGAAKFAGRMAKEQRRLRGERQRRQASEERLRIAQELHDVLGHHLSLINVRAGVGRHLMDSEPDQARAALDTIKLASAEALREVQSVFNAIYPTGQALPRAPAPGLDRLDELTVDAGLPVHTTIIGEPPALPPEIGRAAYRIVQEALTNVRRHAGPDVTAAVTIEYRPQEEMVLVQVEDDGGTHAPVTAPTVEGNGISGMRERATTLGGTLTARPLPNGGWHVSARLRMPSTEHEAADTRDAEANPTPPAGRHPAQQTEPNPARPAESHPAQQAEPDPARPATMDPDGAP